MSSQPRSAVPITVLTGFLGAGKTTLLNRILNGDHGLRVGVLVNDFGSVNIDAELVVGVENDMVSLANGCVCCQIRDDLVESVLDLVARPDAVEYVLLEASGVADPGPISMTFSDPDLCDRIRLDSVTCVVDAEQVFQYKDYPAIEMLKLKQIGFSDLVILNKADLAGPQGLASARNWIKDSFNRVRVVESSHCEVPLEILLAVGRFDPAHRNAIEDDHGENRPTNHRHTFATWTFETDESLSITVLREVVKKRLPAEVYRCKGIIQSVEQPDQRVILQCVGRRTEVRVDTARGGRPDKTQIVAIGAPDSLCIDVLDDLFRSCIA